MRLTEEQFKEYQSNPLAFDSKIRAICKIPEDKYYTVGVYPEKVKGDVRIERSRTVKSLKISKSDQKG